MMVIPPCFLCTPRTSSARFGGRQELGKGRRRTREITSRKAGTVLPLRRERPLKQNRSFQGRSGCGLHFRLFQLFDALIEKLKHGVDIVLLQAGERDAQIGAAERDRADAVLVERVPAQRVRVDRL